MFNFIMALLLVGFSIYFAVSLYKHFRMVECPFCGHLSDLKRKYLIKAITTPDETPGWECSGCGCDITATMEDTKVMKDLRAKLASEKIRNEAARQTLKDLYPEKKD